MTSYITDNLFNTSYYTDVILKYSEEVNNIYLKVIQLFSEHETAIHPLILFYQSVVDFAFSLVHFNEFQISILKYLLLVLIINLFLICIYWKLYGKAIGERFMKPATSRAIEELKASVDRLKLPKVHTPRI